MVVSVEGLIPTHFVTASRVRFFLNVDPSNFLHLALSTVRCQFDTERESSSIPAPILVHIDEIDFVILIEIQVVKLGITAIESLFELLSVGRFLKQALENT